MPLPRGCRVSFGCLGLSASTPPFPQALRSPIIGGLAVEAFLSSLHSPMLGPKAGDKCQLGA